MIWELLKVSMNDFKGNMISMSVFDVPGKKQNRWLIMVELRAAVGK
jgi:hypothetical protein